MKRIVMSFLAVAINVVLAFPSRAASSAGANGAVEVHVFKLRPGTTVTHAMDQLNQKLLKGHSLTGPLEFIAIFQDHQVTKERPTLRTPAFVVTDGTKEETFFVRPSADHKQVDISSLSPKERRANITYGTNNGIAPTGVLARLISGVQLTELAQREQLLRQLDGLRNW